MRKLFIDKLPILIVGLVAVFLIVAVFLYIEKWDEKQGNFPEHEVTDPTIEHNGTSYVPKDTLETFLVLGLDKYDGEGHADSYNNNMQADFLLLFVLDNATKQYTAIHINRDTMVDVNVLGVAGNKVDTIRKQIALAHTYGNGRDVSCHNTADSVSSLLMGVKVNHYISVTLDAVTVMNDLVGGVEVVVLDDFTGIDNTLVKGETVTLKGSQALTYIRTREALENNTNTNRMKRQEQYLESLLDSFKKSVAKDDEFIVEASLKMSDHIISDRSVTQLQALAEKFDEYEFLGIRGIEGESVVGKEFMEFYPDESAVKELVVNLFYKPKA
ncbi:MAG: LCP family protein [Clostridia bacterium]|nr:LCP family protein [Clostridia bacterium]